MDEAYFLDSRQASEAEFKVVLHADQILVGASYEWKVANQIGQVMEHYRLDPLLVQESSDGLSYIYPGDDPRTFVRLDRETVVQQLRDNPPILSATHA